VNLTACYSSQLEHSPPKKKQKVSAKKRGQEIACLRVAKIQYPKPNGLQSTLFQEKK